MNSKRPPFTVTESEGDGGRGRGFRGGGHLISEFKTLAHMSITPDSIISHAIFTGGLKVCKCVHSPTCLYLATPTKLRISHGAESGKLTTGLWKSASETRHALNLPVTRLSYSASTQTLTLRVYRVPLLLWSIDRRSTERIKSTVYTPRRHPDLKSQGLVNTYKGRSRSTGVPVSESPCTRQGVLHRLRGSRRIQTFSPNVYDFKKKKKKQGCFLIYEWICSESAWEMRFDKWRSIQNLHMIKSFIQIFIWSWYSIFEIRRRVITRPQ